MSRLTIDMTPDDHRLLKSASALLGVSMREFVLRSAFEKLEEMEDEKLAKQARKALEDIKSGKDKLISWDEMKNRLDQ